MTKKRIKTVVTAVVLAISPLAWAGFQFVGPAPLSQGQQRGASSVYLAATQPAAISTQTSPTPPDMNGYVQAFKKVPVLAENGAGIAQPCQSDGSAPLNDALYKLMPEGWSLYAKPGTLLNLPVWYSCHDNPWTSVVAQVLKRSGYEGTLWWGYDILTIAPRPMRPLPGVAGMVPASGTTQSMTVQKPVDPMPGTSPMTGAKSADIAAPADPVQTTMALKTSTPNRKDKQMVMACKNRHSSVTVKITPVTYSESTPATIGANGAVIQPSLKQKVIPLNRAVRENWRLELPEHPNGREVALAKAWLNAGGTLFSPLPQK